MEIIFQRWHITVIVAVMIMIGKFAFEYYTYKPDVITISDCVKQKYFEDKLFYNIMYDICYNSISNHKGCEDNISINNEIKTILEDKGINK